MTQEQLFSAALMIQDPWFISNIDFDPVKGRLDIAIDFTRGASFFYEDKELGIAGSFKAYDTVLKTWRHLNFFQFECYLHAHVPRVDIGEGKVRRVHTPWEGKVQGFTLLMEALILTLSKNMPVNKVAESLKVTGNRIWRLLARYIESALEDQDLSGLRQFGVDETAVLRGHNYVSLFVDLLERKTVFVTEGKGQGVMEVFARRLVSKGGDTNKIKAISQDMSPAFRAGAKEHFPKAQIIYDRFHIMKMINEALDIIRRQETKNHPLLKKSRMALLKNEENLTEHQKAKLEEIKMCEKELRTARAWRMKRQFQELYKHKTKRGFENGLRQWIRWVMHSNLQAMKEVAKTFRNHWDGIVNWASFRVSNGILEGLNSVFQAAKSKARGYRKIETIKTVIYALTGKFDFAVYNPALPT